MPPVPSCEGSGGKKESNSGNGGGDIALSPCFLDDGREIHAGPCQYATLEHDRQVNGVDPEVLLDGHDNWVVGVVGYDVCSYLDSAVAKLLHGALAVATSGGANNNVTFVSVEVRSELRINIAQQECCVRHYVLVSVDLDGFVCTKRNPTPGEPA